MEMILIIYNVTFPIRPAIYGIGLFKDALIDQLLYYRIVIFSIDNVITFFDERKEALLFRY